MTVPKVHLYLSPGSCSLAPHILLHESGLPFTHEIISLKTGFPREKLHLNPKGVVPILILDGETITENPAILTAIAQLVPSKHLLGRTNLEIVRSYEWMSFISGKLHGQAYGALFRPARFVDSADLHEALQKKAMTTIRECYEFIEGKLEGRTWAVGDHFTVVDAYLLVFYRWGNLKGFEMAEQFPNYTRLAKEVAKRDSAIKAVEVEGIDVLFDGGPH